MRLVVKGSLTLFYTIVGSGLAEAGLGLVVEGAIHLLQPGFSGQFLDLAPHRWPYEKGHFLQALFRFDRPVHGLTGNGAG